MRPVKSIAQSRHHRTFLHGVGEGHTDPGHRLQSRPWQPDGDHQGSHDQEAGNAFHLNNVEVL